MNNLIVAQKIPGYLTITLPSLYQPAPTELEWGMHQLNIYDIPEWCLPHRKHSVNGSYYHDNYGY